MLGAAALAWLSRPLVGRVQGVVDVVTFDEIKLAAEAQADVDCARGLADLDRKLATAAEYVVSGDGGGKRLILAERQALTGMRDFLAESIERQRTRDDDR